jgi:hypothetical protein
MPGRIGVTRNLGQGRTVAQPEYLQPTSATRHGVSEGIVMSAGSGDRIDVERISTAQDFGRELTFLRERARLTVRAVSSATGLSVATVATTSVAPTYPGLRPTARAESRRRHGHLRCGPMATGAVQGTGLRSPRADADAQTHPRQTFSPAKTAARLLSRDQLIKALTDQLGRLVTDRRRTLVVGPTVATFVLGLRAASLRIHTWHRGVAARTCRAVSGVTAPLEWRQSFAGTAATRHAGADSHWIATTAACQNCPPLRVPTGGVGAHR